MRFLSEYYTITPDEYSQECKMLGKDVDIFKLEEINLASKDCEKYKQAIVDAAKVAHKQFIEPHMHKNIIYSRTWGKA